MPGNCHNPNRWIRSITRWRAGASEQVHWHFLHLRCDNFPGAIRKQRRLRRVAHAGSRREAEVSRPVQLSKSCECWSSCQFKPIICGITTGGINDLAGVSAYHGPAVCGGTMIVSIPLALLRMHPGRQILCERANADIRRLWDNHTNRIRPLKRPGPYRHVVGVMRQSLAVITLVRNRHQRQLPGIVQTRDLPRLEFCG